MTVTAVAGFLINIAMFLQIKVTTPLTNTISGTAKVNHLFFEQFFIYLFIYQFNSLQFNNINNPFYY